MLLISRHKHDWGDWQDTNKHYWSHAKTVYRWCRTCSKDEYRLVELLCPQYKAKGKYCHWCEDYEVEWKKRLKTMVFDGVLDGKLDIGYNEFMKHIKKGKVAETLIDRNKDLYKFILAGHSFAEAAEKYGVSRARAHQVYQKFDKKMQKVV